MRRLIVILLLIGGMFVHVIALGKAAGEQKKLAALEVTGYVVPAPIAKIISLEYDSLVSDFQFLKALIFIGRGFEKDIKLKLKQSDWIFFHELLTASAGLDTYFVDPYYLGNAYLTWYAGMPVEANTLVEKGARSRDWDWVPPFFIGFNYFYFLEDNEKAAEYLMEASRRPDASPMLASLASKLAYKANQVENSIQFLKQILMTTEDASLRKEYQTRIEVLESVLFLEKAADLYRKLYGRKPQDLAQLVQKGIIKKIPTDPYGGQFYLDSDGRIKTTSEDKLFPYKRNN